MPIEYKDFIHPEDQAALKKLQAIPMADRVIRSIMKNIHEDVMHGVNLASKVRIGPSQLPELHSVLVDVCARLGLEVPDFYLEMSPLPNAYTFGDTKPFVVVNSGLIDLLSPVEVKSAIAHECGHILCHHVLYHSVANLLKNIGGGVADLFGMGIIEAPLKWALQYWVRRSEFSADRVAAFVMEDATVVARTMMHLAGGASKIVGDINLDLFVEQANEYRKYIKDSGTSKALQNWEVRNNDHPYPALRAAEVMEWYANFRPMALKGDKLNW